MKSPEQFQPIKKAVESMTPEQRQMSQEREATFEAGRARGHKDIVELAKKGAEQEGWDSRTAAKYDYLIADCGFSDGVAKLFKEHMIHYDEKTGRFHPQSGVTEEQMMELVEKLPLITDYDVCGAKIVTVKLLKKLFERFPDADLSDTYDLGKDRDFFKELSDELGIKEKNPEDYAKIMKKCVSTSPENDSQDILLKYLKK